MLNLIRLELKKNNLKGYIRAFIIATLIVGALALTIVGVEVKDMPKVPLQDIYISMLGIIFLIIEGTMLAGVIIDEYSNKTITLMYQYPISRIKIHLSKLLLIYCVTSISLFVGHVFLNGFLYGMFTYVPHFAKYSFSLGNFGENLIRYALIALYYPLIGFIPLIVGMYRKTARATIIASVILVTIVGNNNGGGSLLDYAAVGAVLALCGLLTALFALRKVNTEDVF